ncbi:MAG: hypothetical protein SH808_05985 [Saprospiraceae bacterium]|nr:hypothetical protein [Saprospiraceae bacterium]
MKLNKNLKQISATAVITSLVFVLPMAAYEVGPFSSSPVATERITWQKATDMQTQYLDFRPLRVQFPENDNRSERKDLKGFKFSASQLNEIINANKSGETPDEVYFFFGQEGRFGDDFLGGLFHDSGNIRLIAVGMKNNNLLNKNPTGTEISVFDKADPCPPNCPN